MYRITKSLVPKYKFATKKSEIFCKERKRVLPHLKDLFVQNIDSIKSLILKSDLKFTSLVAHNLSYLNIQDDEMKDLIIANIKQQLDDLTPELAHEVAVNIKELIEPEDFDILESLYAFTREYFFLFSERQLAGMERVYLYLNSKSVYSFTPIFKDMLSFVKNQHKGNPKIMTQRICESVGFEIPHDELDVIIQADQRRVNITFKKLQKSLTIQGVYHQDFESILKSRDLIAKKKYDFFFMEMAPITQFNLNHDSKNKEIVIEKFLDKSFLDSLGSHVTTSRGKYLSLFDRFDKLPILESKSFDWYVNNVLSNSQRYRVKESERLVYVNEGGLERPDELSSILYQLSEAKIDYAKMMFCDMNIYDELNVIANKMSLAETRDLFRYGRYYQFNESLRWALKVNKSGCPMCSKSNRDPPIDLINMIPHSRYDFTVREMFMANQIIEGINNFDEHTNYIGFFGEDHVFEITKHICNYYSKNKTNIHERVKLSDEEIFKNLLRQNDLALSIDKSNTKLVDEHTNKFAMLAALFYDRNEFDIPRGSILDLQLYNKLKAEYKNFLQLESFVIDKNSSWKKYKQEERCFGVYTLLHDDKFRFGM